MFVPQERLDRNPYTSRNTNRSYIRVLHAVPNAPAVDVYANGIPIARNLGYRGFTEYQAVKPGTYNIEIYPAGRRDTPVLRTTATLPGQSIFTIAAVGQLPNISLLPIASPKTTVPPGMAMVRFSHLSPTAPNVDITLPDGTVIFSDVRFKETENYIPVPAGTYRLQARIAGTDQVVLDVPNINLGAGKYYTVYAVGLPGSQPPLQVLIPLDGPSYINP